MGGERRSGDVSLDRIATVPNLLSVIRICMIPVFMVLLLHHGTELGGLLLLGLTVSTDWVDGYIARRTGQVSNVGKLLDPLADRLAIAAALVALIARGAFPLWAALLILVRDGVVLIAGVALAALRNVRIDVRWIGKVATFALMCGVPLVAWGRFGLWSHAAAGVVGWTCYAIGIVLYYIAVGRYAIDVRRALRTSAAG